MADSVQHREAPAHLGVALRSSWTRPAKKPFCINLPEACMEIVLRWPNHGQWRQPIPHNSGWRRHELQSSNRLWRGVQDHVLMPMARKLVRDYI